MRTIKQIAYVDGSRIMVLADDGTLRFYDYIANVWEQIITTIPQE